MKAKVSIIVPVYNMEMYLNECLDSLVNQTFKEIEIICFNDASTDRSLSILQEFAKRDERVKIIDSKVNIKQGGGRNAGIRQSSTDKILFVDADDKVDSKMVEILYNAMIDCNADIVVSELYNWIPNNNNQYQPDYVKISASQIPNIQAVNRGGIRQAYFI